MSSIFDPPSDPSRPHFPSLPIVQPDTPPKRRAAAERYGGLFYLGVGGLVVVLALVAWFVWGAWSLRSVWSNVYVLHDARRTEVERVQAAHALSRDPRVTPRQLYDIALRRPLPPLARYLVAEKLTSEAVAADPRGYTLAVVRSEGWPDWLRSLLARPVAYAATRGEPLDAPSLVELSGHPDPAVALWGLYARAVSSGDAEAELKLRNVARDEGPYQSLARRLLDALEARSVAEKLARLDTATHWLRTHDPGAAELWRGWDERDGRLTPRPAPELHPAHGSNRAE